MENEDKAKETTESTINKPAEAIINAELGKKGTNWTKLGIIFAVIAVILAIILVFLFLRTPAKTKTLNITYSIELENGSIIDSGTNEFAEGEIGSGLGFVSNQLDKELKDISIGETKTITLEAKDAYGEYDKTKAFNYERVKKENRTIEINRTNWLTIDYFKSLFNEEPQLNKVYNPEGAVWPYKVVDKNETHVKISSEPTLETKIPYGPFNYKVIKIDESKIVLKLEGNSTIIPTDYGNIEITFTENEVITTLTPEIGQEVQLEDFPSAKVTGMNSTHLFLDANAPYAGNKIIVKITLNNIRKTKPVTTAAIIPNAPTLQVFIMSYCPYGLQALKGLLPVWEKFQGKANIELRFVSYTMHGQQEEIENKRMICIREEQYSKLIPYLKCFVEAGDSASCLKQATIDEAKLNSCMATRASSYYDKDKELNKKYGVQGSPTFVLDGKEVNIYPRDPQSIANAICNAFIGSKPSVCSEKFSTANPSPGFGGGTSNSGGSCG